MNKTQQGYFESIPQADELYFTKDGLCFRTKQQAEQHHIATGVPVEEVEGFTKADYEASLLTTADNGGNDGGAPPVRKPYSRMNKPELTEEAAKRGLDISAAANNKAIVELLQADDAAKATI